MAKAGPLTPRRDEDQHEDGLRCYLGGIGAWLLSPALWLDLDLEQILFFCSFKIRKYTRANERLDVFGV